MGAIHEIWGKFERAKSGLELSTFPSKLHRRAQFTEEHRLKVLSWASGEIRFNRGISSLQGRFFQYREGVKSSL